MSDNFSFLISLRRLLKFMGQETTDVYLSPSVNKDWNFISLSV